MSLLLNGDCLEELNAVIEYNFKKFAKYVMKIKGIPYDKGGIQ